MIPAKSFVDARAFEIKNAIELNRMELVEYPRQLRRRNSSYNRYLKKPRFKKESSIKKLITNKWHAKRMNMEELWNWSIPKQSHNNTKRFVLQRLRNTSVACDISYYTRVILKGKNEITRELLSHYLDSSFFSSIELNTEYEVLLYSFDKFPMNLLCNSLYYEIENSILLYIHPFNLEVFLTDLKTRLESNYKDLISITIDNDLCCYEFYSKNYYSALQSVILRYFKGFHSFELNDSNNSKYCTNPEIMNEFLFLPLNDMSKELLFVNQSKSNNYTFGGRNRIHIFVSKSYSIDLLLSLSFECCSIIGIYELYSIYSFRGLAFFPFDFIDITNSTSILSSPIQKIIENLPESFSVVRNQYIKTVLPSACNLEDLTMSETTIIRVNVKIEKGGKEGYGIIYDNENNSIVGLCTNIFYNPGCAIMTGIGFVNIESIHKLYNENSKYELFVECNNNGNKVKINIKIAYE